MSGARWDWVCPEHGLLCPGADCCCADLHISAESAISAESENGRELA